jgi:hypothetical protein
MMRAAISIVTIDVASRDTVRCLRELLLQAEAGQVVGVAWAAIHRRREYSIHACGEAFRNPTYSSGIVGSLWFDLQRRAHGER